MTYYEFKNKYNETYIDYDKKFGDQCWDLAQQYFTECLGLPEYILSGCGLVSNMLKSPKIELLLQYFDEVDTHDMRAGDVCIWTYGHIALYDDYINGTCYYFSQNYPLNYNCHVQPIGETDVRAFRLKTYKPPVTSNVERDENKNQIEVKVDNLNVRTNPSLSAEKIGQASIGFYNFYETKEVDGYIWYNIDVDQWIASSDEWTTVYPVKEKPQPEYKTLKWEDILEKTAKELNTTVDELMKLNKFNYPNDENIGLRIRVK